MKVAATPCMFVLYSCSSLQTKNKRGFGIKKSCIGSNESTQRKTGKKNIDLAKQLMVTEDESWDLEILPEHRN